MSGFRLKPVGLVPRPLGRVVFHQRHFRSDRNFTRRMRMMRMKGHIRCFFTEKTRDAMSVRAWLKTHSAVYSSDSGATTWKFDGYPQGKESVTPSSQHSLHQSVIHSSARMPTPPTECYLDISSALRIVCVFSLLLLESSSCPRFHICFSPLQESFTGEKSASTLASSTSMRTPRSASF